VARLEVVPFSDEHLDDAGRLLAARHTRQRAAEPVLPERFEEPVAAQAEVEEAWRADGASGATAIRDGRVVGYLIGAPRAAAYWGDNVWVELAGHAVEEPEDLRDLYALAAARWVEEGGTRQYTLVPATDSALLEAWYRLSFGQQHAHGLQSVTRREVTLPEGVEIRAPVSDEVENLIDVDLTLPTHQSRSPVFGTFPVPSREELRKDWAEALADDDDTLLVAYRDGRPLAVWSVVPLEGSAVHKGVGKPENAAFIGFAATLPESQGTGIGLALTDTSFNLAADQAYDTMVTDWRVTNLLASRFWTRRGFRPFFLRLYRSIP
jgi:ribosomal protein S18 acetylase RimI-like enzyme